MRHVMSISIVAATVLVAVALAPSPASAAIFQGLGHLPGGVFTVAHGVSSDGSVVVGYSSSGDASKTEAFRWTRTGGMQGLGFLPGSSNSYAYGVSGDGSTVVGGSFVNFDDAQAFRWTSAGGMQWLGFPTRFPYYAVVNPSAASIAISSDGSTIVGARDSNAYRWTRAGGLQLIDFTSAVPSSSVSAISADGSVFVGSSAPGPSAFRWTSDGGFQHLGVPPGEFGANAHAVSADGSVVVGWNGTYAFRWTTAKGTQLLGDPRFYSSANGVSGDGSILVGYSDDLAAFIWDETRGMRSIQQMLVSDYGLDLTGWGLFSATAISADGNTIVGTGAHLGRTEAWIATIPEPASLTLLSPGSVVLLARRRRAVSRSVTTSA